jgi:hypothetical protein
VRLEQEGLELRGMGRLLPLEREGRWALEPLEQVLLLPRRSEEEVSHPLRDSERRRVRDEEDSVRSREGVPQRAPLDPLDLPPLPPLPRSVLPLHSAHPPHPPHSVNQDSHLPNLPHRSPRPLLPHSAPPPPRHSEHQLLQRDSERSLSPLL